MIVELVIGEFDIPHDNEYKPQNHLQVREQEDNEDEPLEIQLSICPDAQSVADCQQDISEECGDPVHRP